MRNGTHFFLINISFLLALNVLPAQYPLAKKAPEAEQKTRRFTQPKKHTTVVVFISADNDLHYFAWYNIAQMKKIGSNKDLNIVVQINSPGINTPTRRFYIEKNNMNLVSPAQQDFPEKYNSGSPYTLVDCMRWAADDFPADHYFLIVWDHATGVLEPGLRKSFNKKVAFSENNKLELDKGAHFISEITQEFSNQNKRGICFDDSYQSYISNQELEFALREIHHNILGRPLDGIGFDACLMGMIEVAKIVAGHSRYMISSQDIEYGTGCDYTRMLQVFTSGPVSPRNFAQHMVRAYGDAYETIANDFTQSAFDLTHIEQLEENINEVALMLIQLFDEHKSTNLRSLIKLCKSPQYCTCFDEPSYIDLGHFYKNLLKYLPYTKFENQNRGHASLQKLYKILKEGLQRIKNFVIENATGTGVKNAHGVSIYFPEYRLAHSYLRSHFGMTNNWSSFLGLYIMSTN